MTWNWEQPDWPDFAWNADRLTRAEQAFLVDGGVILGSLEHLTKDNQNALVVETITTEAMTTSEIEGELLDRDSVQSSIRKQLGLAVDHRRAKPAEQGIAELMVSLYQNPTEPLSHELLFEWHRMVTHGRRDLRDIGAYRTHKEPMQVVSGRLDKPTIHFEAPPSSSVPEEMERFVNWFNSTSPTSNSPLPAITRSGIAHLYFVSIHPFEDGNGRLARALSEKALAQALDRPTLTAQAATILVRRNEYYDQLEAANKGCELTDWLAWFAGMTLESQHRSQAQVSFVLEKTRLLDRLGSQLNERQEKVLHRMLREGPHGFQGGLSASNYVAITKATSATATRDLAGLVDRGALIRTGERKGTRYHLNLQHPRIPHSTIGEDGVISPLPKTAP
ncbi:cell filamentation protein Fic [bacterium]|nr:MAG: cell filamentation protein Fic [bacterium]